MEIIKNEHMLLIYFDLLAEAERAINFLDSTGFKANIVAWGSSSEPIAQGFLGKNKDGLVQEFLNGSYSFYPNQSEKVKNLLPRMEESRWAQHGVIVSVPQNYFKEILKDMAK